MNLDATIAQRLRSKRFLTAKDVLVATQLELVEALDISYGQVEQLLLQVSTCIAPPVATVRQRVLALDLR